MRAQQGDGMEIVFPAMLSVDGKNAGHLTRWEWFAEDPLVVRCGIRASNGVQQWELPRDLLIRSVVHGEPMVGVENANIRFELPEIFDIPQVWKLMSALLPQWDQEGDVLLIHMSPFEGPHQHVFLPTLWLAPFLERTMEVVPDGAEEYDIDLLIRQIFEEAEREAL